ncbi:RNA polymerase sigma-70 factor, ECF subfamily [Flagellimonas pacifica]|uniref:RNA polymerase sigma-70 factor, ECF subfamily n=2 Tax=Flagellimonas pacifica TaxID=1247520 RepID=A0A285MRC0_9FLAO|nr:RNA polymerase sigma-70 factor, ECF subfamily [Allomuricauda parva]
MMETIKINDLNNQKLSESEIIKRILSGEKELYEILLRRNNQKLFRVIRSYIKDGSEIEDIMQNTYLKAFEKLYQFKHSSSYGTWLIRIGINEVLARLKEKEKVVNLYQRPSEVKQNSILEIPDKNQLNPEKRIIRNEAKQFLENAIDSLSLKYRTVYMLREIEEMSINEISECLDVSKSNVKVRLHRAKNMLKERLYELTANKEDVFGFGFSRCDNITDSVMRIVLK